jgi:hypothetical protein
MMIPASATLSSRQSERGADPRGARIGRQKRDGGIYFRRGRALRRRQPGGARIGISATVTN